MATTTMLSSDMLKTPRFFSTDITADENANPFETSFMGSDPTEMKLEHANSLDYDNASLFDHFPHENATDMFGFSPRASPGPFPSRPQPPLPSWQNNVQQYPNPLLHRQVPSPATSSQPSPIHWPYRFSPLQMMAPQKIAAQGNPGDSYLQYGQVTPPDDTPPHLFQQYEIDPPESQQQHAPDTETIQGGKRKRGSQTSDNSTKPSKRSRKSSARSKTLAQKPDQASQNPEDEKRNKFLERNRVAASKCRQKKKEWTSNLESRARELQASKNELAMMVCSYKDEIMFLKGEMLKHTTCGCDRIRNYLTQEADNIAYSAHSFQSAASPVGSEPSSRLPSVSSESSNQRCSRQGSTENQATDFVQSSPVPVMQLKLENELESLLANSLAHDTSDETIAPQTDRQDSN